MGTGVAVTALTERITAAKMNLKLETVDTANITAENVTGAKLCLDALDATNVLKVTTGALAGGLKVTSDQIEVSLEATNPSLAIVSNELGIKFVSTGGLEKGASGTSIKVKASSGLTTDADGIQCVLEASKGISMGASGLALVIEASKGLAVGASGLATVIEASKGLTVGASGLACVIEANKGLAVGASGFATVLEANKGLSVGASGLAVDYDDSTIGIVTNKLAVKATGVATGNIANNAVTSAKMATKLYQSAVVQCSNADLLGIRAAAKQLVAAPGANKTIIVDRVYMVCDSTAGAYTESVDNLVVEYSGGTDITATIETTGFITTGDVQCRVYAHDAGAGFTPVVNEAVVLKNIGDGEFGGGNAANTLSIIIHYTIQDTVAFTS